MSHGAVRNTGVHECVQNCSALWLSATRRSDVESHKTAECHIHSCIQESHGVGSVIVIIGFVLFEYARFWLSRFVSVRYKSSKFLCIKQNKQQQ